VANGPPSAKLYPPAQTSSYATDINNGFFLLVEVLLQFHSRFFSPGIKLRGLMLSALTVSLNFLQ